MNNFYEIENKNFLMNQFLQIYYHYYVYNIVLNTNKNDFLFLIFRL